MKMHITQNLIKAALMAIILSSCSTCETEDVWDRTDIRTFTCLTAYTNVDWAKDLTVVYKLNGKTTHRMYSVHKRGQNLCVFDGKNLFRVDGDGDSAIQVAKQLKNGVVGAWYNEWYDENEDNS